MPLPHYKDKPKAADLLNTSILQNTISDKFKIYQYKFLALASLLIKNWNFAAF